MQNPSICEMHDRAMPAHRRGILPERLDDVPVAESSVHSRADCDVSSSSRDGRASPVYPLPAALDPTIQAIYEADNRWHA